MDPQTQPESKPKKSKEPKDGNFTCFYVRFHQPVPPATNKEPVSEFSISSIQTKYLVDSILYTPDGLIWQAFGEKNIVPLANVIYARMSQ